MDITIITTNTKTVDLLLHQMTNVNNYNNRKIKEAHRIKKKFKKKRDAHLCMYIFIYFFYMFLDKHGHVPIFHRFQNKNSLGRSSPF